MAKEICIKCTWVSYHYVEVEDDFTVPDALSDFPVTVLEELTSDTAELVDWK